MIANPRLGQRVQVWYRKAVAPMMQLHGCVGKVVVVCRGRPRNHGVVIGGVMHVVPCGNLRPAPAEGRPP